MILEYDRLPRWFLGKMLDAREVKARLETTNVPFAIQQSIPDWMHELGQSELGNEWQTLLPKLNEDPQVVVRVNTLKGNRDEVRQQFKKEKIHTRLTGNDGLIVSGHQNIFRTKAFQEGLVEVQDGSSQLVAPFLEVKPGMTVVDACAGSGGKTLHLAALMQNKGRLMALDNADWKLKRLKQRAKRAGISNLEIKPIITTKIIKRMHGKVDRLLLDVPCSGLGVLKRNPDIKWSLQPTFKAQLLPLQADLMRQFAPLLKIGGAFVYATCSILPSENEKQVEAFLENHKDSYQLEAMENIVPKPGHDGFFMARVVRVS